jgi:SAM-dependent methyltransferase
MSLSGGPDLLPRVREPEVMDTADEAADYDAMDHAAVNAAFCDDLLRLRRSQGPGARPLWVLDLGTGTARIPIALSARDPHVRIVGTELADHMLALAAENVARAGLEERVLLQKTDAKRAPSGHFTAPDGGPFDVVCSNSVVHHLPEPRAALAAWWSGVAPGSLLFVRDLARPRTEDELAALVALHVGAPPAGASRASFERQVELFRASLRASLRLDELRAIVGPLGVPPAAAQATSDRHLTLAVERPR